jgi:hypothetical protein
MRRFALRFHLIAALHNLDLKIIRSLTFARGFIKKARWSRAFGAVRKPVTGPALPKFVPAHADSGSAPVRGLLPPNRAFPNLPAHG